ncbi:MAG: class I SAM-dependent RNA methyltransferase [Nitrospirae bacterium]|nr:class I SAM-dependent RNA methyltransferase [Nitrospirota bacterium]
MYEYQKTNRFFAQIADDIKELGARELSELGATAVSPEHSGAYFNADKETLYRINYTARITSRILAPLVSFNCRTTEQLYRNARKINWADFFSEENTFAVFSNVSSSTINNSHYAALCLKDAIVDSFRERTGRRPDVDRIRPDVWLNLYIRKDKATISLDTSGGSLHRRGYREEALSAPMQETVAAAIIRYAEWDGSVPLYDPMCGSGTLLCEALMHYCRIPSGVFRKRFGFEFLPDYDEALWKRIKEGLDQRVRALPAGHICGSDLSSRAVEIAKVNTLRLRYGDRISLRVLDFRESEGLKNGVIITNPPYGIRMGEREELALLYKSLGDFLKKKCTGSTAYIYFGEREFIKKLGLRSKWKKPLKTGGLDGRLVKYEIF